jgi:ferrous iron transport protein A
MISRQEINSKSIDKFSNGSTVRIIGLNAGKSALSRLCSLGLVQGTLVKVLTNGSGPVRLKFRDTEVVIGRNFAEKIIARMVEDDD